MAWSRKHRRRAFAGAAAVVVGFAAHFLQAWLVSFRELAEDPSGNAVLIWVNLTVAVGVALLVVVGGVVLLTAIVAAWIADIRGRGDAS